MPRRRRRLGRRTRPAPRHPPGRTPGRGRGRPRRTLPTRASDRRRAPSAFSGPWTPNGTAPRSTASRNRWTHGSPGASSSRRGHTVTVGPQAVQRLDDRGAGPRRHEHLELPVIGRREGGGSERRVPARGDGQAGLAPRRRPPARPPSGGGGSTTRCRALWLPATFPVSSFTHTPPSELNPRSARQPVGPGEGRRRGTRSRRRSPPGRRAGGPARARHRQSSRWPARTTARPVQPPNATSGFGSSAGRERPWPADDVEDVVSISRRGVRATPRMGRRHVDLGAADRGTGSPPPSGSALTPRPPRSPLNSAMSSSHTGR